MGNKKSREKKIYQQRKRIDSNEFANFFLQPKRFGGGREGGRFISRAKKIFKENPRDIIQISYKSEK